MTCCVIISERTLLAEAVQMVVCDRGGIDSIVAGDSAALHGVLQLTERPDLLIDLEAPGMPLPVLRAVLSQLTGRRSGLYDIFTSTLAEEAFLLEIRSLVSTRAPVDEIVAAVTGHSGSVVTIAEGLSRKELQQLATLSPRELEVLEHVARGHPVRAISQLMGITSHTVESHRRRALHKLGETQQAQAVAMLARAGLLPF